MQVLALRRWSTLDDAERRRILARSNERVFDPGLRASIQAIYDDVAARGDVAVSEATARFDKADIPPERLRVTADELAAAHASIDADLLAAIREAIANVRAFSEAQLAATAEGWRAEIRPGVVVGEKFSPIPSAGLFVPCGKASYPSVLVQIGTPAVTAGVPDIAVVVPPVPGTSDVDVATLATAHELGLTRVYRANGPAGIAAIALGTETIGRVRKVVGPGSPAVTMAQIIAQAYGVLTSMISGPSESVVVADGSADPKRVALDLLNEAEHGEDSAALLLTDSLPLAEAVDTELTWMVALLPEARAKAAHSALGTWGGAFVFGSMAEALDFANTYAVEHIQLATADPEATLGGLRYAGEALLGQHTTISETNFVIGVPATLPTGGFAQVTGGVTARTFTVPIAISKLDEAALAELAAPTLRLADHEGFPAHANALRLRGLG
ncbi:MAG: histidinol dehydrogenase [Chloroflexi bacterium]|jgi:histidinol dehydrogenase|nr:histidinol dehydrogenase [Chloroflexota bacterium]